MSANSFESQEEKAAESCAWFLERVATSWPYVVEVMLHRRMGIRYLDSRCAFGLLVLLLYPLFWERYDLRPFMIFTAVFVFMHCAQRLKSAWMIRQGDVVHSYYDGYPLLLRLCPWVSEATFKRLVEPLIIGLVGIFTLEFDHPLAVFLIAAGVLHYMMNDREERRQRMRAMTMNDAWLDNQMAADRFRGLRGSLN